MCTCVPSQPQASELVQVRAGMVYVALFCLPATSCEHAGPYMALHLRRTDKVRLYPEGCAEVGPARAAR